MLYGNTFSTYYITDVPYVAGYVVFERTIYGDIILFRYTTTDKTMVFKNYKEAHDYINTIATSSITNRVFHCSIPFNVLDIESINEIVEECFLKNRSSLYSLQV